MKPIKQILFLLLLSSVSMAVSKAQDTKPGHVFHTIQSGETLYKLSGMYNISVKDICNENPGLSAETFRAGQVIRIPVATVITVGNEGTAQIQLEVKPRCKDMHRVKRKETIFSVSREYGISGQELIEANPELRNGMKKGQLLCIPYPETIPVELPAEKTDVILPRELFREKQKTVYPIHTVKAALILPFLVEEERKTDAVRMIEYYEGFLMAVDSLKRKGTSIDLHVYNSGGEHASIAPVLAKEELKNMDIIFGPLYKQHIRPLAAFADEHDIRLVVPVLKDDEVFHNEHIYQVNAPQSYLYSEVYERFTGQFPNGNVIILDMYTEERDKGEFVEGLKMELEGKGIPVQAVTDASLSQTALKDVLRDDRDNIFIPTSGSIITLNKIMPLLKVLLMENPTARISLFGYPEWQTCISDNLDNFFELDTYFYSSFYASNLFPATKAFNQAYRRWYSKEMLTSYPKYGMLGFDTALFFLTGLDRYGTGLEYNLSSLDLTPVQTGFRFERVNNWGGFVNKKVFFIHFTRNFELIKLDFEQPKQI